MAEFGMVMLILGTYDRRTQGIYAPRGRAVGITTPTPHHSYHGRQTGE